MYANKWHKQAGRQVESEQQPPEEWNEDLKQSKKELDDGCCTSRTMSTARGVNKGPQFSGRGR
jgi:hypothetical protein